MAGTNMVTFCHHSTLYVQCYPLHLFVAFFFQEAMTYTTSKWNTHYFCTSACICLHHSKHINSLSYLQ